MVVIPQTFFGKIYKFTTDCADKSYAEVAPGLNSSADYCVENICWDVDKYPFCLCGDDGDPDSPKTGCNDDVKKFSTHYITSGEAGVYNNSFSNPFMAMVRLVVLISTENYPDVMCKCTPLAGISPVQGPGSRHGVYPAQRAQQWECAIVSAHIGRMRAANLNRQPTHAFYFQCPHSRFIN